MQLEELSNISDNLAMMPDPALQQFAQMHKTDPYMVSLALSESSRRKKLRTAAQGQAGAMPQPKVVDAAIQGMTPAPAPAPVAQTQLPENQGIAQISAPNMRTLADGGIAGYEDDEEGMATGGMGGMFNFAQQSEPVVRMAGGGIPGYKDAGKVVDYRQAIIDEAQLQGVPAAVALQISGVESSFDPNAKPIDPKTGKPRSSAKSLFQVIDSTFKGLGGDPKKRNDPMENIRVGVKYLAQNQAALTKTLGRAPKPQELYATHFLGTDTGSKLLSADPSTPVGTFLDKADPKNKDKILTANPEVLGGKKTVGDVLAWAQKKMAPVLTSAIPIGSAQAEQVPQAKPAAAPAPAPAPALPEGLTEKEIEALCKPAFVTPSSGKGRKEGKLSEVIKSGEAPRQMMLGAGDLPYNLAGGLFDISHDISKVFGNKSAPPALGSRGIKDFATKYLGREPDPTDPTLKGFRTAGELGSMVVDPMSTTRKVAQTAEGLEALAMAQRAKANAAEAVVAQPVKRRIEMAPTQPPVMVVDEQGRAMPAGTRASVQQGLADEAAVGAEATKAMALEKQAAAYPGAAQRAEMLRTAEMADKARGTALAAKVGDPETMRNLGIMTERPEVGESVSGTYDTTMPPPKAIVEAAKEATPAKERKGFGDDDLLMLGLSLMANKSPNFMTALGEAGIQTLGAKREREKGDTEKLYRDALIEQAKRPSSEVQLIEKYRDDPKFAEAYDKFAQARRDPQSREALMKSWSNSIYLQSQYPNFEDYLKIVSPAGGSGALGSQLNASDQSLIQKYLR